MSSPSEPLVLAELDIPGRTGPVAETPVKIWGINIAAALGNFPLNGLLCQAGPWGNMAVGDTLTLYWGTGQNVWVETVDKIEVNTQLRMFVPSRHMVDGRFAVSYTVKPLGGTDQPSEVMQVQVKLTRPGGHDDNDDSGHSKLIMTIPKEIADGGIDKENVAEGVPITIGNNDGTPPYPFAAAGDVIRISWGGVFMFSEPLTQEQAEGKAPIIVTITEAVIREAGDADSPGVAVVFEVYDCVFNRSEDWSPEQRVPVAVDATRADAPLLKETLNNVLDVDKLGDANGTVQIIAMDKNKFEVGDLVFIRIKGTPVEGPPIDWEPSAGVKLESVPSVMEIMAPNAVLRQLAKSQITLSYRLEKADASADLRSKSQFIHAIGEIRRLAAPIMLDENSGALDPTLLQISLEIPFDKSFVEGQVLKIVMLGTTPGLKPYLPDLPTRPITHNDIVEAKPLQHKIDGEHLTPVNGGTAEFYYQQLVAAAVLATLDPFEATRAVRESIHTKILQVGEPRLELPEPVVAGVVDGVLPADTAGTTSTVPYIETVAGDEVFMFWIGSLTGEYTDSIKLNEFTAGKEVPFNIEAKLIKNNEGGAVIARYEIKRTAGGTSYAEPLEFSVGMALDLTAPGIKEAPNGTSLDPFAAKEALTAVVPAFDNMVGTQLSVTWTGTAGHGSHTTVAITVTTQGPQNIVLPNSLVAHNLSASVTVTYRVIHNDTPWDSKPFVLTVQPIAPGDTNLPVPNINGAVGSQLDVANLADDAKIQVAKWPLQLSGQTIWLRYDGIGKTGSPVELVFWAGAAHHYTDGLVYAAQVAWLRELKDGSSLTITFKVNFNGVADAGTAVSFPVRTYLIGNAIELEPPSIKEAIGNSLNPFAAKDTLTAVIPAYDDMVGTQLSVTWTGTAGHGSHTTVAITVTTQGPQSVPLPNSVVPFNLGKPVTVIYTIISNGTPKDSKPFLLAVQPIAHGDPQLGMPLITQATNGGAGPEFDVRQLTADATIRVNSWPLIALRQYVWLELEGTNKDDSVYAKTFWQPPGGTTNDRWISQGYYTHPIPLADLKNLKDGSELNVIFKAGLVGSQAVGEAVSFPVKIYTVKVSTLEIDTTPMVLDGLHAYLAPAPYTPPFEKTQYFLSLNTHQTRHAQGGSPPYEYVSSDPTVASVTKGLVVSTGNGTATISVHDTKDAIVSYQVTCENVYELVMGPSPQNYAQAIAWLSNIGASLIPLQPPFNLILAYGFQQTTGPRVEYWANSSSSVYYKTYSTGLPAQWTQVPFVAAFNAEAPQSGNSLFVPLGYRPKSGKKSQVPDMRGIE
ncbi:hypothetical protein [Pseudomonas hamedanensis]|uniref:BIG2 domain-containing protein n=1 Tax=Pseudomonas hamedanensis TaxID=2745504 RepID=A0A9E6THE9_9PSED|nr:hypothetical protein [Pseudomonas hamedanensis]QXI18786.1 hypothetical protein HU739_007230 [Pseudomonas hamedanensis]